MHFSVWVKSALKSNKIRKAFSKQEWLNVQFRQFLDIFEVFLFCQLKYHKKKSNGEIILQYASNATGMKLIRFPVAELLVLRQVDEETNRRTLLSTIVDYFQCIFTPKCKEMHYSTQQWRSSFRLRFRISVTANGRELIQVSKISSI